MRKSAQKFKMNQSNNGLFGAPMVIDHEDLRRWQVRMGFSYDDAAAAFGVDRSTYAVWLKGVSRGSNLPFDLPRIVQLSAMAIEMGLANGLPPAKVRPRGRRSNKAQPPDKPASEGQSHDE